MPIQFNLPNKTAAQSAEFSRRFNELPNELQNMIIAETVMFCKPVPLHHHRRALGHDTPTFAADDNLFKEAVEQFFKANWFLYWIDKPLDQLHPTASLIRHLNLTLTISAHGGDVQDVSTYMLRPDDVDYIQIIPRVFRFLERLQLTVDNAGWINGDAWYTSHTWPSGTSAFPNDLPDILSHDRMSKMSHALQLLRELEFPCWRRDLVVKKKVLFNQADLGDSQVFVRTPGPYPFAHTPEYLAAIHGIMDFPHAVVYIDSRD